MTDNQLYDLCQQYGREARKWTNKFVSLLPEVYRRRLYRKKGFCSIHEFAAKVGGVGYRVVDEALRINEKLKDKPKLKALIPEMGISKLKTVACVAKKSTDEFWAEKVKKMTRKSLEVYVKDVKFPGESKTENVNLSLFDEGNKPSKIQNPKTQNGNKSTFSVQLSGEAIFDLRLIKQKLEKECGEILCWDEVIKMAAEKLLAEKPVRKYKARPSKSRAIPAAKRREQSKKCIAPCCNKLATEIHHLDRYALTKNHDRLAPMCKSHHELAHHGHIDEQNDFRTLIHPIINPIKQFVDQKMLGYSLAASQLAP
jgi:hypothetical protein